MIHPLASSLRALRLSFGLNTVLGRLPFGAVVNGSGKNATIAAHIMSLCGTEGRRAFVVYCARSLGLMNAV